MTKRNLANMDRDIFQGIGRILQEAMAHGITNDMLYGGLEADQSTLQGIHEVSLTKNCAIGTRRVGLDGSVYRYSQAGFLVDSSSGCWSSDYQALAQWAEFGTSYAAGVSEISVVAEVTTDGVAFDGVFAKDVLQGGYITLFPTGIKAQTHLITGNTALAAPGELFIQLAYPTGVAITSGAGSSEAIFSPYRDDVALGGSPANNTRNPIVGIPKMSAAAGEYFWNLTWGPTHCTTSDGSVGSEHANHNVCFASTNGSLIAQDEEAFMKLQRAGFVLAQDYNSGSPQAGAPFIMLQISP